MEPTIANKVIVCFLSRNIIASLEFPAKSLQTCYIPGVAMLEPVVLLEALPNWWDLLDIIVFLLLALIRRHWWMLLRDMCATPVCLLGGELG